MNKKKIILNLFISLKIILGSLPSTLYAEDFKFKVRAREHYESVKITNVGQYKGFTHRFNFWWENPMKLSYGLVLGPIWAPLQSSKGDKITLYNLGPEVKWFPNTSPIFIRAGSYANALKTSNLHYGISLYLGSGIEIKAWGVGFAFEYGLQYGIINKAGSLKVILPSIGVHFYDYI